MNDHFNKILELLKGQELHPATLYVVATPIGNLGDISLRALTVLQKCDLILAEDTRRTGLLLHLFGIKKKMLSCHKFNEWERWEPVLNILKNGGTVAVVTDSGTPGISDPGQYIIQKAITHGIRVEPVPGPVAFITALMGAGLPTDEIHFVGFLPKKSDQLQTKLTELLKLSATIAIYESPHRMPRLLETLSQLAPDRTIVIARELTKKFEQFIRGRAKELWEQLKDQSWKGELVVLIEPLKE